MALLIGTALLIDAIPGRANEGKIEINQAGALAGGITASDTLGFPVSLDQAGSYVLTSNLTVSQANETGLLLLQDDITIDLNGFTIQGLASCSDAGTNIACTPAVTGQGIAGFGRQRVTVRNGFVRGFLYGIRLGRDARVEEVIVSENQREGIYLDDRCILQGNVAHRNGGIGFRVDRDCVISGNVAYGNGGAGIRGGGVVLPRTFGGDRTVIKNVTRGNGGAGIHCADGCSISLNTSTANGLQGIWTGQGSLVEGNTCTDNTSVGLVVGINSGYTNNVLSRTDNGFLVSGAGVCMDPNIIAGTTGNCP